jgi:sucrose phosphorylase
VINAAAVEEEMRDPNSKISLIQNYGSRLNLIRTQNRAFHPRGDQKVLNLSSGVFAVFRTSPEGDEHVLALTNVRSRQLRLEIDLEALGIEKRRWQDLVGERLWEVEADKFGVVLRPYDVVWLKPAEEIEGTGWI